MDLKYFKSFKKNNRNKNKYFLIIKNFISYMIKDPLRLICKNISYYNATKILSYSLNNSDFKLLKKTKKLYTREELWNYSLNLFKLKKKKICFLEFGVKHGYSINSFSKLLINKDTLFFGFDTFTGMPEKWHYVKKGSWSNKGLFPKVSDKRIKFVKGLFQLTLDNHLRHFKRLKKKGYIFIIHNDADLYSSTLYVLNKLSFLKNFYIFFDEFSFDENRAFKNFIEANYFYKYKFISHTLGFANEPDQVFCKVEKVKLKL
jgi:O-methyltransferase